jgi:hypothetical protein
MGIIHTARKNVKDEIVRKLREETLEERKRSNINATLSFREETQVIPFTVLQNHLTQLVSYFYLKENKMTIKLNMIIKKYFTMITD